MRGKSKFERKQAVLEVDEFVVEAVTVLPHEQYASFANNLLYDYDFIIAHDDKMCVDSNGITHVLLVLDEEGDDGILVNSEGAAYARYTGYMSNAKQKLNDEIKEVADDIIQGRFGDTGKGSWVIGFDDIKEHFDLTVTPNNGIGTMLLEALEEQEEVGEIIATEDCFEITEYLSEAPASADTGERFMTVLSLMGCNLEDVHLIDRDEEHDFATIVDLNSDTLTEEGKKDWADIMNGKVERVYEGDIGLVVEVSGCSADRLAEFSYMLAGYCAESDYNKWVKSSDTDLSMSMEGN
jgi:hypothetical protein